MDIEAFVAARNQGKKPQGWATQDYASVKGCATRPKPRRVGQPFSLVARMRNVTTQRLYPSSSPQGRVLIDFPPKRIKVLGNPPE